MLRATNVVEKFKTSPAPRAGIAAAELAVLLPLLTFLFVIGLDFARLFYATTTIANCARNGALYEADPYTRAESRYPTVQEAALADASNLVTKDPTNPPTVSSVSTADGSGRAYVDVTVAYEFRMIVDYPGIPARIPVSRTVRMPRAPLNPF